MQGDTRCSHADAAHPSTSKLWAGKQRIDQFDQALVVPLTGSAVTSHVDLIDNVSAKIGNGSIEFRASHVHPDHDKAFGVELQQGTAATATPLGAALRTDIALLDQVIDDPHHGG